MVEDGAPVAKELPPITPSPSAAVAAAQAVSSKMLERMRENRKDWRIEQVETLCRQVGLCCRPPKTGSHYKITSAVATNGILTIPANRPIKPVYIKLLIELADQHIEMMSRGERTK